MSIDKDENAGKYYQIGDTFFDGKVELVVVKLNGSRNDCPKCHYGPIYSESCRRRSHVCSRFLRPDNSNVYFEKFKKENK